MPPLWLGNGWGISMSRRRLAGFATFGLAETRNSEITVDAGAVRVVHEEPPVRRVARVEREAEEALLAAARDEPGDVEERLGRHRPVGTDDAHLPALLDDEQAVVAGGCGDEQGVVEPVGHLHEARAHGRGGSREGEHGDGEDPDLGGKSHGTDPTAGVGDRRAGQAWAAIRSIVRTSLIRACRAGRSSGGSRTTPPRRRAGGRCPAPGRSRRGPSRSRAPRRR